MGIHSRARPTIASLLVPYGNSLNSLNLSLDKYVDVYSSSEEESEDPI